MGIPLEQKPSELIDCQYQIFSSPAQALRSRDTGRLAQFR